MAAPPDALLAAVRACDAPAVRRLLASGPSAEVRQGVVYAACLAGSEEVAGMLLRERPERTLRYARAVLNMAAAAGQPGPARAALDCGADPNLICEDYTPLQRALYGGSADCVRLLLVRGARPEGLHALSHMRIFNLDTQIRWAIRAYGGHVPD